jgi:2-methylfumaryl-CoA isomerase
MSGTPITTERPAPAHGEHSREVLAELGYAPGRIDQMFSSQASFEQKNP